MNETGEAWLEDSDEYVYRLIDGVEATRYQSNRVDMTAATANRLEAIAELARRAYEEQRCGDTGIVLGADYAWWKKWTADYEAATKGQAQ